MGGHDVLRNSDPPVGSASYSDVCVKSLSNRYSLGAKEWVNCFVPVADAGMEWVRGDARLIGSRTRESKVESAGQ